MITETRIGHLQNYFTNLRAFYKDSSKDYFNSQNTIVNLNTEEIIYLNNNINLDELTGVDYQFVLNFVLSDNSKYNFAKHLITFENIDLNINYSGDKFKSVFILLIENAINNNCYNLDFILFHLFQRGYQIKEEDNIFLIDFYKNRISNQSLLELWCIARIFSKIKDTSKVEKAYSNLKLLMTLVSFKLGKPVGIKYPNLIGVANNAILHYREYGEIILYAIDKYNVYKIIEDKQKIKKFEDKVSDYKKYKPIQDIEFNQTIYKVFPELSQN